MTQPLGESHQDPNPWETGEDVRFPALYATDMTVAGNAVKQLVRPGGSATIKSVGPDEVNLEVEGDGAAIRAVLDTVPGRRNPYLVAPLGARTLLEASPHQFTWLRRPAADSPPAVLEALRGRFRLVEKTSEKDGFRTTQVGAVHAVLGYWTTESTRDATIVMPTGTGKTDTMVALFAAALPERLLVLVPSDALRKQIAEKFESLGILPGIDALGEERITYPVVGRLGSGMERASDGRKFARACNVVVTTPNALHACSPEARLAFTREFSHLFVDEAHHVKAKTWEAVRSQFAEKSVLQFTATPYREDGLDLGGLLIYRFPLRVAQRLGYFSHINYRGVRSMANPDRLIAETALEQLRHDLRDGLDHVVMARVRYRPRADHVANLYRELGPEFGPRVLYSGMKPARAKRDTLEALNDRTCRVIVCVDMLGEGFDLSALKIAAMHDTHKSLGVTLQFVGRFARVDDGVGDATVVVGRPDSIGDENLRALYREDSDWNLIIRDLSERATEGEQEASEFDEGFSDVPIGVATHQLRPKMSAVAYRTRCDEWDLDAALELMGEARMMTVPIPHNRRTGVAWFVLRTAGGAAWGPQPGLVDVAHDLYVMYWDRINGLLYIDSSNNDSSDKHHQRLAEAIAGDDVQRIRGDDVFRVFAGVDRLVPTNVGLLDIRNRARKHAQYAGANVNEGFPEAEKETKTQTNIFAHGHEGGDRVSLGASLSGRVWARRVAASVLSWVQWCDTTGAKLIDPTLNIDEILASFIRPELLGARPALMVLAAEWPAVAYTSMTGDARVEHGGQEWPVIDTDLRITSYDTSGPIPIAIATPLWTVPYEIDISATGIHARPASTAEVRIVSSSREMTFEDYVSQRGLTLLLEHDAVIEHPGVLYRPNRDLPAFPRNMIQTHVSWQGTDLTVESQGKDRRSESIQRRVIDTMAERGRAWTSPDASADPQAWELIIDDDGSNELADVVAVRRESGTLFVQLVHCKYSSEATAGARVEDLYEVCGQAQKSVARRRDLTQIIPHLIRREKLRQSRGRVGFEVGDEALLYELESEMSLLLLDLSIVIVQPGVSAAKASASQLDLLAATEMFVLEVGGASLHVVASP